MIQKIENWKGVFMHTRSFVVLCMIVIGGCHIANQYYVKYDYPSGPEETDVLIMKIRPNAPGSYAALLEKYGDHCWTDDHPLGQTDAVIVRIDPYDPYIHTRKPRLIARAIDQAVHKKDRNIDQVLAFCTDKITQPRESTPNINLSF